MGRTQWATHERRKFAPPSPLYFFVCFFLPCPLSFLFFLSALCYYIGRVFVPAAVPYAGAAPMIANVRFIYRAVWPANSYFIEAFIPLTVNPGLPRGCTRARVRGATNRCAGRAFASIRGRVIFFRFRAALTASPVSLLLFKESAQLKGCYKNRKNGL